MVYVGRHHVRSSTAAAPPCRRTPSRRAAVLVAAACATVLTGLFPSDHAPTWAYAGAPATLTGPAATEVRPEPTAATTLIPDVAGAAADPVPMPGPVVPDSSAPRGTHSPWSEPDTRHDPYPRPPGGGLVDDGKPPGWPGFVPDLNLGYDPGNPALRGPEAGSPPSVSAPAPTYRPPAAPVAEERTDRWDFLQDTATGEMLFLTGFLLLLLSIGGLITVGLYRRRW